jgi:hypothetical protein
MYLAIFNPPFESSFVAVAAMFAGMRALDSEALGRFEPGYPAFVASGLLLFGEQLMAVQVVQACVAAAGAVLLYALTVRLTSSRLVGLMSGLLYGTNPLLVRQATAPSDLALVSTLLVGFCLAFIGIRDGRTAAFAGLWLGVTIITRSMTLPLLFFAVAILLRQRQTSHAIALTLATAALVVPMAAHNYVHTGLPWPTRSGINLYIGNSPYTSALLPTYDLDLLEGEAYEQFLRERPDIAADPETENAEFDTYLTEEALEYVASDPDGTLWQKFLNVGHQLSPFLVPFYVSGKETHLIVDEDGSALVVDGVPRPAVQVWSHATFALLLLAGSVVGVWYRRRLLHRDAVLWAVFVTFIGVNAVYVPATRYTAPMLFVMIFYTAVGIGGATSPRGESSVAFQGPA